MVRRPVDVDVAESGVVAIPSFSENPADCILENDVGYWIPEVNLAKTTGGEIDTGVGSGW